MASNTTRRSTPPSKTKNPVPVRQPVSRRAPVTPAPQTDGFEPDSFELNAIVLRDEVIMPLQSVPLAVEQGEMRRALQQAHSKKEVVVAVTVLNGNALNPTADNPTDNPDILPFNRIGTEITPGKIRRVDDGAEMTLAHGVRRVEIIGVVRTTPTLRVRVRPVSEVGISRARAGAERDNVLSLFAQTADLTEYLSDEVAEHIATIPTLAELVDTLTAVLDLTPTVQLALLTEPHLGNRTALLVETMQNSLMELRARQVVDSSVQEGMNRAGRENYLRERIRIMQNELGEKDPAIREVEELREKLDAAGLTTIARERADRELARLANTSALSPEMTTIRTYLEWLSDLPWSKTTDDNLDIAHAVEVLDGDHFGLPKAKDRIIEFIAVRKLAADQAAEQAAQQARATQATDSVPGTALDSATDAVTTDAVTNETPDTALDKVKAPESPAISNTAVSREVPQAAQAQETRRQARSPILCFIGPPGTGKTSLGRSIARALGREFVRISLGGVGDEAEIRGHRRTYIGALPGRVLQGMQRAGTINPVFMLDEIDKLGNDFRGDPSAALLEVLDPEQNFSFSDHYLELPYDLSQVLFVATANSIETIPDPLLDRLEVIEFSGYTEEEKVKIAREFIIPRQVEAHALQTYNVQFDESALQGVIRLYTWESGVRNLEREIAALCRKIARRAAEGKPFEPVITRDHLLDLLGPAHFLENKIEDTDQVGVVTGLAWTENGGEVLTVEATLLPGKANVTTTGQLGEVMEESVETAFGFIRSQAKEIGILAGTINRNDIHIHLPEAAVPKDGPSAGVTMALAMVSALTGRAISRQIALTGEISLRGRVLPVGGIKEKVLAAHRAGLRRVILPEQNRKDIVEIPAEIRDQMQIDFVSEMKQIFKIMLGDMIKAPPKARKKPVKVVKTPAAAPADSA